LLKILPFHLAFSVFFFLLISHLNAQTIQIEVNPKRIDWTTVFSTVSGPEGSFYALSKNERQMKLALVKIDSGKGIKEGPAAFRIEKVINFFSLFKNHQMNAADFPRLLCSSADGRWLGIYVPLQKKRGKSITGKVLLVDFLKESIRVNQDVEKWVDEAAIFEKKFTFHEFTDTVNIKGVCMNPRAVRSYEYDLKTNVFRTSSGFEISPSPYNQIRLECLYRHPVSGTSIYRSDSGIVVENSRYGFLKTYSANPVVRI
jgi:hypothetical protein